MTTFYLLSIPAGLPLSAWRADPDRIDKEMDLQEITPELLPAAILALAWQPDRRYFLCAGDVAVELLPADRAPFPLRTAEDWAALYRRLESSQADPIAIEHEAQLDVHRPDSIDEARYGEGGRAGW